MWHCYLCMEGHLKLRLQSVERLITMFKYEFLDARLGNRNSEFEENLKYIPGLVYALGIPPGHKLEDCHLRSKKLSYRV